MTKQEITLHIAELEILLGNCKGEPCQIYSRIVGYFQPLSTWNAGQLAQYHNRVPFELPHE